MTTPPTTRDLINGICQAVSGEPADALDWRQLLRVRDLVDRALSAEVNRRQADDATEAIGARRDRTGEPIDPDAQPPDPRAQAREHLAKTLGWSG